MAESSKATPSSELEAIGGARSGGVGWENLKLFRGKRRRRSRRPEEAKAQGDAIAYGYGGEEIAGGVGWKGETGEPLI